MARNLTEAEWSDLQRKIGGAGELPVPAKATAMPKPRMNKWETEYSWELEARRQAGEILWWAFEPMKLRLAKLTTYTPDFGVLTFSAGREELPQLEFHEVKGFWRDDARVKIKMAAELFPFRFIALTKQRAKDGGGWRREVFTK